MITTKKIFLLIICFSIVIFVQAQNKEQNLGEEQVVIVKGYKPVIADAAKISDIPERDTTTQATPVMSYSIAPVVAKTDFTLAPIKPIKVKDENIKELYHGYIKAGYGTQSTPLIDLYYNALRSKDFNAGIHLKHLSSKGTIKGYGYPDNSHNSAEVFGRKYFDYAFLGANVAYNRNVYHYYGYDADMYKFGKSDTKHALSDIAATINYESINNSRYMLDHKLAVGFYSITDNLKNKENDFNFNGFAGTILGPGYVNGTLEIDLSKFEQDSIAFTNNAYNIRPRYKIKYDPWTFEAGFNLDIESFTDSTKAHLYPYIHFDYVLGKNVNAYGEFSGGMQKHSWRSIVSENPFLSAMTGTGNTNTKINLLFGINVKLDQDFHFNASVNYRQFKNELFYFNVNRTILVDTGGVPQHVTAFAPVYYDGNELIIHGELAYEHEKKLTAVLKVDYLNYSLDSSNVEPWHVSPIRVGLALNYNLGEKIIIKSDWFLNSSRYYYDYEKGEKAKLNSILDFNLGADYRYSKVLSIFLNINNIAYQKYQQWYNYPSYKMNVLAGVTYSF